jgi:hypothetical protein
MQMQTQGMSVRSSQDEEDAEWEDVSSKKKKTSAAASNTNNSLKRGRGVDQETVIEEEAQAYTGPSGSASGSSSAPASGGASASASASSAARAVPPAPHVPHVPLPCTLWKVGWDQLLRECRHAACVDVVAQVGVICHVIELDKMRLFIYIPYAKDQIWTFNLFYTYADWSFY